MTHRQDTLEVLAKIAGVPEAELAPEQHLVADLGVDSPKALRLLVELEDRLDIEIEDEQAAALKTVGDVLAFVERHAP
jgi:acyl carrier protein